MREEDQSIPEPRPIGLVASRNHTKGASIGSDNGLTCSFYKANGGTVIEFRKYDPRTDRNDNSLYVVSDEEDFGSSFAKIVTVELMRM